MFPERLVEGYKAFLDKRFSNEHERYKDLAEKGQHPEIMVIGCVDSRVSPEVIFDAAPANCWSLETLPTSFLLLSLTAERSTAQARHWSSACKPCT